MLLQRAWGLNFVVSRDLLQFRLLEPLVLQGSIPRKGFVRYIWASRAKGCIHRVDLLLLPKQRVFGIPLKHERQTLGPGYSRALVSGFSV